MSLRFGGRFNSPAYQARSIIGWYGEVGERFGEGWWSKGAETLTYGNNLPIGMLR